MSKVTHERKRPGQAPVATRSKPEAVNACQSLGKCPVVTTGNVMSPQETTLEYTLWLLRAKVAAGALSLSDAADAAHRAMIDAGIIRETKASKAKADAPKLWKGINAQGKFVTRRIIAVGQVVAG